MLKDDLEEDFPVKKKNPHVLFPFLSLLKSTFSDHFQLSTKSDISLDPKTPDHNSIWELMTKSFILKEERLGVLFTLSHIKMQAWFLYSKKERALSVFNPDPQSL